MSHAEDEIEAFSEGYDSFTDMMLDEIDFKN